MFVFDIKNNVEIKAILLSFNDIPLYAFDDIETAVNFMQKSLLAKPQFSSIAERFDVKREIKRLNYCIQSDIEYIYIVDGKEHYKIGRMPFFHYRRDPIQQVGTPFNSDELNKPIMEHFKFPLDREGKMPTNDEYLRFIDKDIK